MLEFYPEQKPHTLYFEEMTDTIPDGGFYLKSFEMMSRSINPARFVLVTDTQAPVEIYVNNVLVKTVVPTTGREVVKIPLAIPPATNKIKATNGIDEDVHLTIAATNLAAIMEAYAIAHYDVAGRTVENFLNNINSPINAFFAEWLLPWQDLLPDIHTLRGMAVKLQSCALYNEAGTERGTINLISGLTLSTPVVYADRNPEQWLPHLYQPITQADDNQAYTIYVWLPNLCIDQRNAFVKLFNNLKDFSIKSLGEQTITILENESEFISQETFNLLSAGCNISNILLSIGCFDNLVLGGSTSLTNSSAICYWSNTFSNVVENPGIGGKFFDSLNLDTAGHVVADETNRLIATTAYDLNSAIDLASYILTSYNAHDADPTPTWHYNLGGSHQITAPFPFDLGSLITFCLDAQAQYTAHLNDSNLHSPIDTTYPLSITITASSSEEEVIAFLNDFKVKYNDHINNGNLDTIYDIDKLTDYWVGTSLAKTLNPGCFDLSSTVIAPGNLSCCTAGPDTKLLTTVKNEENIVSTVTPNNPVFGGDDPGLLLNPYFNL